MSPEDQSRNAREQLTTILSFFPRVDAKFSVVLGVDVAMLGYLAGRLSPFGTIGWIPWVAVGSAVVCLSTSLWHLYQGSFPQLDGGASSLIYFGEIAKRTELKYADEYLALSQEALTKDLLGQVWRNSAILSLKFSHLVWAYRFMALGIIPWLLSLALLP